LAKPLVLFLINHGNFPKRIIVSLASGIAKGQMLPMGTRIFAYGSDPTTHVAPTITKKGLD
jgi:hypothetical protein